MNQIRDWDGSCQRCMKLSETHTMSMFDVALICMDCAKREQDHPRYSKAREADVRAIQKGDHNFSGIGVPEDLDDS